MKVQVFSLTVLSALNVAFGLVVKPDSGGGHLAERSAPPPSPVKPSPAPVQSVTPVHPKPSYPPECKGDKCRDLYCYYEEVPCEDSCKDPHGCDDKKKGKDGKCKLLKCYPHEKKDTAEVYKDDHKHDDKHKVTKCKLTICCDEEEKHVKPTGKVARGYTPEPEPKPKCKFTFKCDDDHKDGKEIKHDDKGKDDKGKVLLCSPDKALAKDDKDKCEKCETLSCCYEKEKAAKTKRGDDHHVNHHDDDKKCTITICTKDKCCKVDKGYHPLGHHVKDLEYTVKVCCDDDDKHGHGKDY